MRDVRLAAVLGAAFLLAGPGHATTVKDHNLRQLADLAERVFIGEVVGQQARLLTTQEQGRVGRAVVTETTLRIDEVVLGPKHKGELLLTQAGGSVPGELTQEIGGQARFTIGERVLVFIERASTGQPVVAGMALGKYTLETSARTGQIIATRDATGLHRVGQPPPAKLHFAGFPASEDRLPLDELVGLIKGDLRPSPLPMKVRRPAGEGAR